MELDQEACYRAVKGRDRRFDGMFYTAVRTTGIYCRPSCPAITPRRRNVSFYRTAAGAQGAGYRACRRCLPDATPGSPEWDIAADVASRAMRLVSDGVVEREGVEGLASALGYSTRQLNRVVTQEYGAGPLALARSRRAQTARVLIETTDLSFADIAFAAGFASVRQFNDTVREVYAATPTRLREGPRPAAPRSSANGRARSAPGSPYASRSPPTTCTSSSPSMPSAGSRRPGPGGTNARCGSRTAPGSSASSWPTDRPGQVPCTFTLTDARDLAPALERTRRLLDADCDPVAVDEALAEDPVLAGLVAGRPGLRVPGHLDGIELAVQTVLGQQVSLASARTSGARLVEEHGEPLDLDGDHEVTHLFPTAATIAAIDPATLRMPRSRATRADRSGRRAGRRRGPARPQHRPRRDPGRAAGAAGDRALDRRLRDDAGAR